MLISPTEPPMIKALGTVSSRPERFGVDVLFSARGDWVGVQRKEINDLLASLADGRLAKELGMMKQLTRAVLLIEGKLTYTMDGLLMVKGNQFRGTQYTRKQIQGLMWSVQSQGVWVDRTESLSETVDHLQSLEAYCRRDTHTSLSRRPGPVAPWGKPDNHDYAIHLVMGLPGVGPELADRLVRRFGGVPFGWRVTKDELMTIEGIGKKKAEQLMGALGRVEARV